MSKKKLKEIKKLSLNKKIVIKLNSQTKVKGGSHCPGAEVTRTLL